jgi:hypothetical protein
MQYLCLIYNEEKKLGTMPKGEYEVFAQEHLALDEELRKSDHYIASAALQPVRTAMTVRIRQGKLSRTRPST